jgi:hypothetical protein
MFVSSVHGAAVAWRVVPARSLAALMSSIWLSQIQKNSNVNLFNKKAYAEVPNLYRDASPTPAMHLLGANVPKKSEEGGMKKFSFLIAGLLSAFKPVQRYRLRIGPFIIT